MKYIGKSLVSRKLLMIYKENDTRYVVVFNSNDAISLEGKYVGMDYNSRSSDSFGHSILSDGILYNIGTN